MPIHDPNADASPFNALPWPVVLLCVIIGGIEAVFQLAENGLINAPAAAGWRQFAFAGYAFSDQVFEWMRTNELWPMSGLRRFVTYGFLHLAPMHAVFACVLLLALGKFVGERFSTLSLLAIFFGGLIFGAFGYAMVWDFGPPLVGAYPGVYALIGALTWFLYVSYETAGQNRLQAFQLIGVLVVLNLVFRVFFGGSEDWIADLFGFAFGFCISFFIGPGAHQRLARLLARSRQR